MFQETMQCLFNNADKLTCLAPYAYEPGWIYFFLIVMMLLSAVGLPLPEEVTLVSVGILAYMGANPDKYPPPFPDAPFVHPTTAAIVAFFAVFLSDFLIYGIGRFFGSKVFEWGPVKRVISAEGRMRIEKWTHKYGSLACGIFRFTPGIRFPGHLACGMVKFPAWKFALVDGIAAMISVPTQILILAHYGEDILGVLRKFKFVVLGLCVIALLVYLFMKWRSSKKAAAL
ncbi:DedA family protein [Pseudobdellovibrio sp. HCB154]|uniref:DedA family protein n=1 Tax=Pseudobdellovibrio sp. HCB154 TaxID=3386277 RepID=UPI0039174327